MPSSERLRRALGRVTTFALAPSLLVGGLLGVHSVSAGAALPELGVIAAGLSAPTSFAEDASARLFVVDGMSKVISMNADGSDATTIATGLTSARGIAVDGNGHVLVCVSNGILKMNADGSSPVLLGRTGTFTATPSASGLASPTSVLLSSTGKVYVADFGHQRVVRMDADGSNGVVIASGFTQLSDSPQAMAFDPAGHLYVADYGGTWINRYDADGSNPKGVAATLHAFALAADGAGHLYVTSSNGGVLVASTTSDLLDQHWLGTGSFVASLALALDGTGGLYLADGVGSAKILQINADSGLTATAATGLGAVRQLLWDGAGHLFALDNGGGSILRLDASSTQVPDPPRSVAAVAGVASATVSWAVPAADGGAPVLGYTATASPGGSSCSTPDGYQTSCSVPGLTQGSSYTFTVTATNAVGTSSASSASSSLTLNLPAFSVVAKPAKAAVVVSWTQPSSGKASWYEVTATNASGSGGCNYAVPSSGPESDSCTVSAILPGRAYAVAVVAHMKDLSTLRATAPGTTTPRTTPTAPNPVAASVLGGRVVATWSTPSSDGGSTITSYTARVSPGGATCSTDGSGSTCSVGGLATGRRYQVIVSATNAAGSSPASSPTSPVLLPGPPGAPGNVVTTSASAAVAVSWTPPVANGGSAITSYTAVANPGGASCTYLVPGSGPELDACSITNLTPGVRYAVAVVATNAGGDGPPTKAATAAMAATTPSGGTNVTAQAGPQSVQVSWNPPLRTGFSPATSYTVTLTPGSYSCTYVVPASGPELDRCTVTGVPVGRDYSAAVTATNVAGTGTPGLSSSSVRPYTVPSAPYQPSVTVTGPSTAYVGFGASSFDGYSTITSYTATASPGGASCSSDPYTLGCALGGLTAGVPVTVTVVANNAAGASDPSPASGSFTVDAVPNAPATVTASPAYNAVDVSWTAPPPNGGTAVTGYEVYVGSDQGQPLCTTTGATTCRLAVAGGSAFTFYVRAVNAEGHGPSRASSTVTAWQLPGAPTAAATVPAPFGITASWTPPASNGGAPVSSYTVTAFLLTTPTTDNPLGVGLTVGTCTYVVPTSGPEADTCTVSLGIGGSRPLGAFVTATTAAGTGPATYVTTGVVTIDVPGSVNANTLNVTSAASSLKVAWSPPAVDGGSAVTSYVATASPGGKTCTTTTATSCTIAGLTNGTAYRVSVVASNAAGAGPASSSVSGTPNPTRPDPPTSVQLTAAFGSVVVSWTAGPNGDSTITGSVATLSPGGATCSATGTTTSCSISAVTAGTGYTATVKATNKLGTSDASSASSSAVPYTTPQVPTGIGISAGAGSVTISWSTPAGDGYSPITGYTAWAVQNGVQALRCTTTTTSCTITGLNVGLAYTAKVGATNLAGTTWASSTTAATPYTTPSAATGVKLTVRNQALQVSWTAGPNGYSPITGYAVTLTPGGAGCSTTGDTTCRVTGLANGTAYTAKVVASNVAGSGVASAASAAATPTTVAPDAPVAPQVTAASSSLSVYVFDPADLGGLSATAYTATASPGGASCTGSSSRCTITGLTPGTSYTVTATVANAKGTSPASPASAAAVPYTTPGAPTGVAMARGDAAATVTWSAPSSTGYSPITSYLVSTTPASNGCIGDIRTNSCTITGLTPGTSYTATVVAGNAAGSGPASSASPSMVAATSPGAPTSVSASLIGPAGYTVDGAVTVSWTPPSSTGGVAIKTYTVNASSSTGVGSTGSCTYTVPTGTPEVDSCTVTGLHVTWPYSFTVTATNAAAYSSVASSAASATPVTPPSAVHDLSVSLASGSWGTNMGVNFYPPTSAGSAATTFTYNVTATPGGATCQYVAYNLVQAQQGCLLSGLTAGTTYTLSVVLSTDNGSRNAPVTTTGTPVGRPGTPTGVAATSSSGQLTFTWTAPTSNGGTAITGYAGTLFNGAGTSVDSCSPGASTRSCTFTGLTNLATYTFTVAAQNSYGTGLTTDAATGFVAPAGFGVYLATNSSSVARVGGTFSAVVANAPASTSVSITFAGGATASCTTTAQGYCSATSSATSSSATGTLKASYIVNGTKTSVTGVALAVPSATCSINSQLVMVSCSLSNLLAGGSATYALFDNSGNVVVGPRAWPVLNSVSLSGVVSTGGELDIYDNGVVILAYLVTLSAVRPR